MAKLTFIQRKIICSIAREAFELWAGRPEFEQRLAGVNTFDAWRHAEQARAVGFRSLAHCDESHYARLKDHFQNLRAAHRVATDRAARCDSHGQQFLFEAPQS